VTQVYATRAVVFLGSVEKVPFVAVFVAILRQIVASGTSILLTGLPAESTLSDESARTSSKRSRHYPRKKKCKRCGVPQLKLPTQLQCRIAKKFLQ